jgi:hypothetical protein
MDVVNDRLYGLKVIDLDAIDMWEFANYEGLGD